MDSFAQTPAFYIALFIHVVSFITGFGSVLAIDTFGLFWLAKKIPLSLVNKVADVTQKLIWLGWIGLVLSGTVLITLKGHVDALTKIKIFFVALAGLNGINLHFLKKLLENVSDNQPLPFYLFYRVGLASAISQVSWWGALSIGFIHNHISHTFYWPKNPYLYMAAIAVVFGAAFLYGETVVKKQYSQKALN